MKQYKITVTGLVQGIGFRPFVAELAEVLDLAGQVKNLGGIVEIIVSGEEQAVDSFIQRLSFVQGKKCEVEWKGFGAEHIHEADDLSVEEILVLPGCRIDGIEVEAFAEDSQNLESESVAVEESNQGCEKSDANVGTHARKFRIVESGATRELRRFLPADMPTCDRCITEMQDKNNRRYRYPFISCTACGPRFSIQKAVPYDRETITMDEFPMCEECYHEYTEKRNIRRHAQTIACKNCGPKLRYIAWRDAALLNFQSEPEQEMCATCYGEIREEQQAIRQAIDDLKNGKIGAIKDIGGYHFAFSPFCSEAAVRLRTFKNRDKKPFAVMFLNMESVREYCEVSEKEEELLLSSARPIVLLKKKKDFVPEICGDSDRIGALLPCNPLQILLLEETGPLVMTSGNRGGEPIIIEETEMLEHLRPDGIDFMLTHDREILTPLDDSIYQVAEIPFGLQTEREVSSSENLAIKNAQVEILTSVRKRENKNDMWEIPQLIRRARGLVPEPIALHRKLAQDTFAAGGDLKAAFALGREELVYMSQYFGDLEDVRCMESRKKGIRRLTELLEIHPKLQVSDLHPAYISAQGEDFHTNSQLIHEDEQPECELQAKMLKVQHHHAHAASVIAEHGLEGKVLGIVCDGTGFGTDGTIWGCEFLICEDAEMMRAGHLMPAKLIGGDASAKQADMTLFSYMLEAREHGLDTEKFFEEIVSGVDAQKRRLQEMAWKQNINTIASSSMGRLFDAAAAVLDICHYNSYEGECAILLEQAAHRAVDTLGICNFDSYKEPGKKDGRWQIDGAELLLQLYRLKKDYDKCTLAYLFHHALAELLVEVAAHICKEQGIAQVVLSGGSFINRILLREVMQGLQKCGKQVYINEKVPCGDGGIALGQMYLASFQGESL